MIGGAFGRTITRRDAPHPVYLFAHDTLRRTAEEQLGPDLLAGFRDRIHAWANDFAECGWPEPTPDYLLQGYPRRLEAAADLPRLAALAVDPKRHHRLLEATGGDAAALAEILAVQNLVLATDDPDLGLMSRLTVWRERLAARNANIPTDLPAVWAMLGSLDRAEALARGISDPIRRDEALGAVVEAAVAAGSFDAARAIAADIAQPDRRAWALVHVVEAAAAAGRPELATRVATTITDPHRRAWARVTVVEAAVAMGDLTTVDDAVTALSTVDDHLEAAALTTALRTVARAGHAAHAAELAYAVADPTLRGEALAALCDVAATTGDLDLAETMAAAIPDPDRRAWALPGVFLRAASAGDHDRAAAIARDLRPLRPWAARILTTVGALEPNHRELSDPATSAGSSPPSCSASSDEGTWAQPAQPQGSGLASEAPPTVPPRPEVRPDELPTPDPAPKTGPGERWCPWSSGRRSPPGGGIPSRRDVGHRSGAAAGSGGTRGPAGLDHQRPRGDAGRPR